MGELQLAEVVMVAFSQNAVLSLQEAGEEG